MKSLRALISSLVLLSITAMAGAAAKPISDQMTLYAADPTGAPQIIRQITVYEDGSFDGIGAIGCLMAVNGNLDLCSSDFGEGVPGNGIIKFYFLPDLAGIDVQIRVKGPGEVLSDVVTAAFGGVGFVSDGDGPLGDLSIVAGGVRTDIVLNEADGLLDVTAVLDTSNHPDWKLTFISDPEAVPEPASLALVALGLLGVGLRRRGARR